MTARKTRSSRRLSKEKKKTRSGEEEVGGGGRRGDPIGAPQASGSSLAAAYWKSEALTHGIHETPVESLLVIIAGLCRLTL